MGEFSLTHILLLTVLLIVFFGPSRLPALGKSIGKTIFNFKNELHEVDKDPFISSLSLNATRVPDSVSRKS